MHLIRGCLQVTLNIFGPVCKIVSIRVLRLTLLFSWSRDIILRARPSDVQIYLSEETASIQRVSFSHHLEYRV